MRKVNIIEKLWFDGIDLPLKWWSMCRPREPNYCPFLSIPIPSHPTSINPFTNFGTFNHSYFPSFWNN